MFKHLATSRDHPHPKIEALIKRLAINKDVLVTGFEELASDTQDASEVAPDIPP